jgi:valyl-tRNA synthetase
MNKEDISDGAEDPSAADRWICARFEQTVAAVHEHFANYRLDLAAQVMYEFTWHEFCDWYLELSKPVLQSDTSTDEQKRATQRTLVQVLEALLRLLHPLMPFITEEIWQQVAARAGIEPTTIMLQGYPQSSNTADDSDAVDDIEWVRQFILGIRQIRGEMDIPPGKPLPVVLQNSGPLDQQRADRFSNLLQRVGRVESVAMLAESDEPPASATALLGNMRLLVPMQGLIDVDAERSRLGKQRERLGSDLERSRSKLSNDNFVNNAPADVVAKERKRAAELEQTLAQLAEQLEKLASLD